MAERSSNVAWQAGEITREQRWAALGGAGATVWFTGLPSSGKSTVAAAVEARVLAGGHPVYVLDGDNLRHGLNGDLGFSVADRAENVRRVAEVAALMADAGVVAIASLVSPIRADRAAARAVHARAGLRFLEVWVSTPLEECERRDVKGLYARARAGEIPDFTGIGQPYEEPESPDLEIPFGMPLDEAVSTVLAALSAARSA